MINIAEGPQHLAQLNQQAIAHSSSVTGKRHKTQMPLLSSIFMFAGAIFVSV